MRALILALLLCANAATAQEVGTAARVNGAEISNFRLERYFEDYLQEKGRNVAAISNPLVYKRLKREALTQLVESELLWQEAKKENVIAGPEEVRAAMEQQRARFRSEESFRHRLDVAGFTEETYKEHLKRALSAQRYMERELAGLKVPDEAVHEFYVGNPDKFVGPGGGSVPEAEVRERVREYLLALKREQAARDAVEALRARAKIQILVPL